MAELHIIGQIVGASGFGSAGIFCKWGCSAGKSFELLEGLDGGQTHIDCSGCSDEDMAVWNHPVDVHYAAKGLSGWPKLYFQVWSQDMHGINDICGYGFCHVPTAPGTFEIDCPTWLPEGNLGERLSAFFIGGNPRLKMEEVVCTPADRFRLNTVSAGTVHLQIGVLMKDFQQNHVIFG